MIKNTITIGKVKDDIKKMQSKQVDVTLNMGRNRIVKYSGTLTGVYPALFTVIPFDRTFKGKTTYSYAEYMCGRVKLKEQPLTKEIN